MYALKLAWQRGAMLIPIAIAIAAHHDTVLEA